MTNSTAKPPRVFLSYSYDGPEHLLWVLNLATRLRGDGVETILDKWELEPGDPLAEFMEKAVRGNDFVLIICTPRYKERSDRRIGGVGYEEDIMTAEVFIKRNRRKFKPVLRSGDWLQAAPTWLSGKVYADLRGELYSEEQYQELLQSLLGTRPKAPPVRPTAAPRGSAVPIARKRTEQKSERSLEPQVFVPLPEEMRDLSHYGVPGARPQDFFPMGVMPHESLMPGTAPGAGSLSKT